MEKKLKKLPNRITLTEKAHKDSRWYVVHTQSGYEYKVANTLKQRVESLNLQKEISDILIPTQEKIVISAGKKRNVQERIFPGYVLIRMNMTDENWLVVRSTDGITGFVGIGTKPSAVSEKEVESVIKFMALETPKYEAKFNVGDGVKMTGGPFQDFIGTVSEINKEQGKVQVLVSIFGRETPVWVDFEQVSPL
ncbi:transcription termination/antitermination protein NusG [bacterium CG2_30_40_12]|uniref:Transcription termination/antitermination protein NusG n=1 Tax=candidate division WWE3 bacterium CG23_combo_of_CG06-09_8_20_14_all_40_14 TaxID=1975095 RepID=A0A2G9XCK7_UNCKA|nr:MAG: transcription termination/antitermination protein NusG [bacterium CG2_30_40_12]PIP04720.1 MAG: transcription termination/antitermination protein NusG [candidate division WWE3 bacterium CG23_combo_of_CG06-09_8_20_14_all_40_14]PJE51849.1 MAG: transcription termination/antitermination protein NusG [candidate division WWE3 bacterium CG10_big_fil_rev_8_21_14_0_10_39_14]